MATVVPNRYGEALEQGTRNLMQMILASRQLEMDEARLSLAERQQRESEKTSSLNRLLAFAPFIPKGRTIAEVPEIHDAIRTVFPEFDPSSPNDLGGVVLNERTMEDVMRPMIVSAFEGLPEERRNELLGRAVNRAVIGTPASDTELEAQESRSSLFVDAVRTLRDDPQALDAIFRTQVGLQQPIRVRVGGRELQWDTSQAASLAVQLMMHGEEMGLRRRQLTSGDQADLAGELMKQMEAAGQPISRSVAYQVVRGYDARSRLYNEGKLSAENDPLAPLLQSENPDVSAAAQFFIGAGQLGERSFQDYLAAAGPAGEQAIRGISVMQTLKDAGVPAEEIVPMTKSVLDAVGGGEPGNPFPGMKTGFWGMGSTGLQITAPRAGDVQGMNTSVDPSTALILQAIRDVVGSGRATREQAVARFGEDVVNQALGSDAGGSW